MDNDGNGNQVGKFFTKLRAVPLFKQLPDEVLSKLARIAHEERYERNDILFEEGDAGDSLFLVIEGTALIQKVLNREEHTYKDLGVAEAGEIFGEMALFDNMARSATIRATNPLSVLRIVRAEFDDFLEADTHSAKIILGGIITILSNRLRETAQHTATLYETGNSIASIHDIHELSRRICERLLHAILHVDAAAFCHWNDYNDECEVLFARGLAPDTESILSVSKTGPMAGLLKYNRTPFVMKGLDPDHPLRAAFHMADDDTLLVGALMYGDDMHGFIILAGRGDPFTSFHRILMAAVCTQVATAVVNWAYAQDAQARQRLEAARGLNIKL